MINNNLKRFGDTSFRLKDQVNFYFNVIKIIKENRIKNLSELVEKIEELQLVNYKKIDRNRIRFLTKQLRNFDLININENEEIFLTNKFKYIENISKKDIDDFYDLTGLDLIKVLFGVLMLNDTNLSEQFKLFIEYLNSDKDADQNSIILFSICETIEEFSSYKNHSKQQIINTLFSDISENDVIEYINNKNSFKDILNKYGYSMRKPYSEIESIKNLIIHLQSKPNMSLSDIKIFLGENEKLKKIINDINKFFGLELKDLNTNKYKILSYFLKFKKYELIYKDYFDINRRWFLGIGLFCYAENKKLEISPKYLKIYTFLNQFDLNNYSIEFIKNEIIKNFSFDESVSLQYPYDYKTIISVLKKFNETNFNYDSICKTLSIYNVNPATIFEYLVNLSFAIAYDYSPLDFKNRYAKTILDDNLKPRSHAVGGQPDGFIEDFDVNKIVSTVESTILRKKEIFKEKEPIQRHAINLLKNNNYDNDMPNCLFIVRESIDENNILFFSSHENSKYINDLKKEVRVIILDLNMFIKILENNQLTFLLRKVINRLPFSDEYHISNIKDWYEKLVTSI
ncbi:MAG: hypothetical protein HDR31_02295 [Mycoplasma sp.]|nr:hypothetical protein [Mycoplasma sp.]